MHASRDFPCRQFSVTVATFHTPGGERGINLAQVIYVLNEILYKYFVLFMLLYLVHLTNLLFYYYYLKTPKKLTHLNHYH